MARETSGHSVSQTYNSPKSGGANYAMADGSAQYLKFSRSFRPINLWAVEESWRTNTAGLTY